MYTHTIKRLAYRPIFLLLFAGGICAGGFLCLTVGLMDRSAIGFFGAGFISLLAGLASGFLGLIYTAVFNTLAPAIGGVGIHLEPIPAAVTDPLKPTDCPAA